MTPLSSAVSWLLGKDQQIPAFLRTIIDFYNSIRVQPRAKPPKDWYGCGSYYYHSHNNTFLDFTGVSEIRFWIKSDVTAKVEVEFSGDSDPSVDNNEDGQNSKKEPIYVNSTHKQWVQVSLPLSHRSTDVRS